MLLKFYNNYQSLNHQKISTKKYGINLVSKKNLHSLVATIDNKIVGYGSIVIETKIRGGKTGHIEDIVSHRNYKKRDVGRSIVNGLFDIAKKKDVIKLFYNVKPITKISTKNAITS